MQDTQLTQQRKKRLNVVFVITSLSYGGAESLLVNLIRRLDRRRFAPQLCCIKTLGPLGEELASEVPTFAFGMQTKYDVRVLRWLVQQWSRRQVDVVVTVGAGDKMFWGRLSAWLAGVPVIVSALHTTGWPDCIGRLNRTLTWLNDAFVGVAQAHGDFLTHREKFPADKVHVIPNGVDVNRFRPRPADDGLRRKLGLPRHAPVAGIVARLGEEKNHQMFLRVAARVRERCPHAQFLVIGDGPRRVELESLSRELRLRDSVHFLGDRADVAELLSLLDVFLLTSRMEANPVSILEALATGKPVVATRVGSVPETVLDGKTGYLVDCGDATRMSEYVIDLLLRPDLANQLGEAGRAHVVRNWSLERMVQGYEDLLAELYAKRQLQRGEPSQEERRIRSLQADETALAAVASPFECVEE